MTIDILKNSSDSITIGSKQFAVRSYKIEHSKNTAKQFTVSGNTKLISKGINPVILIIDSDSMTAQLFLSLKRLFHRLHRIISR